MTPEDLEAIRNRASAATPGPWHPRATDDEKFMNAVYVSTQPRPAGLFRHDNKRGMDQMADDSDESHVVAITLLQSPRLAGHASSLWDENAAFIAHARTDVPALLDEVERLRALLPAYINHDRGDVWGMNDVTRAQNGTRALGGKLIRVSDGAIWDGVSWRIGGVPVDDAAEDSTKGQTDNG